MVKLANPDISKDFAVALAWWRDAGVDCVFDDLPDPNGSQSNPKPSAESGRSRRAEPPKCVQHASQNPKTAPRAGIDLSQCPQNLAGFAEWWMTEPSLDNGHFGGRVPPRGPMGARLMVVVPEPERDDRDTLLSGPQGKLVDAMLMAMGLAAENVYFASALPRHTPAADWGQCGGAGTRRCAAPPYPAGGSGTYPGVRFKHPAAY